MRLPSHGPTKMICRTASHRYPRIALISAGGGPLYHGGQNQKPININNFSGLSREWVGSNLFMCGSFPGQKGNTQTKFPGNSGKRLGQSRDNSGIIPGESRETIVYVFLLFIVFFFPALNCTIRGQNHYILFSFVLGGGGFCNYYRRLSQGRRKIPQPLLLGKN